MRTPANCPARQRPRDGRAMDEAFESPSALLDGDVAEQVADKRRQRTNRHTPAAADVDRLELTTRHELVDRGSPDRQPAGGLLGCHEQLVVDDEGLIHEGLLPDSHSAGPSVVTRCAGPNWKADLSQSSMKRDSSVLSAVTTSTSAKTSTKGKTETGQPTATTTRGASTQAAHRARGAGRITFCTSRISVAGGRLLHLLHL